MLGWTIRFTRNYRISTQYLEEMAAKGWMLKIYGESVMFFEKIEPRKLRFTVDYMCKERHQFRECRRDPHVQEYLELCEESGWTFVDGDGYVYIFCTDDENVAPMQTEVQTYLDSVHYQKKTRMIALILVAILIAIFYGFPLLREYSQLLLQEGSSLRYLVFGFAMATLFCEIIELGLVLRRERSILETGQLPDMNPSQRRGQWERWLLPASWVGIYGALLFFAGYRSVWSLVILLASFFVLKVVDGLILHVAWNHFRSAYYTKAAFLSFAVEMMMVVALLGGGLMPRAQRPAIDPGIVAAQDWEPPIVMADLGRESYPDRVTKEVEGSSKAREYHYREGLGKDYISYSIYVSDNLSAVLMYMNGDKYYRNLEEIRLDVLELGLDEAITWAESDGTLRKVICLRSGNYAMKLYTGFSMTEEEFETMAELFLQWIRENPYL